MKLQELAELVRHADRLNWTTLTLTRDEVEGILGDRLQLLNPLVEDTQDYHRGVQHARRIFSEVLTRRAVSYGGYVSEGGRLDDGKQPPNETILNRARYSELARFQSEVNERFDRRTNNDIR